MNPPCSREVTAFLELVSVERGPVWRDVVEHASAALAGAALWWTRRDGEREIVIASTSPRPPPEDGTRLERGAFALFVDRGCPPLALELVFAGLSLCTERERTETLSRELHEAQAALGDVGFEGIAISRGGVIVEVNQALAELYGYSRADMVGMTLAQLIAPDVLPKVAELVKQGSEEPYETAALCSDGSVVPLEARAKEILFRGEPARVASFRDLRDRKAAAEAREAARRAAERASEQKTVFLGNISHELRTPMNGVLGNAQLLLDEPLPHAARELAGQLHESARYIVDLLDELLDITRIEEGRIELRDRPFSVRAVAEAALHSLRAIGDRVQLRISLAPAADVSCRGDDRRVRQVLLNLLDNAVKYTPAGSVELRVERPGDELRFLVRDTGVGIGAPAMERLFDRFQRGDDAAKTTADGFGLGLHISRRLAEAMGGSLAVESARGVGSTFVFSMPFVAAPAPSVPEAVDAPSNAAPLRVLVAEDDGVSQLVLSRLLRSLGHTVVAVSSGADAVTAAVDGGFDVVLMDVQMPVLDGLAATRAIRDRGLTVPVVGVTAHAMATDLARCREAGMDAWLTKPVEQQKLARVLSEVAGRTA